MGQDDGNADVVLGHPHETVLFLIYSSIYLFPPPLQTNLMESMISLSRSTLCSEDPPPTPPPLYPPPPPLPASKRGLDPNVPNIHEISREGL